MVRQGLQAAQQRAEGTGIEQGTDVVERPVNCAATVGHAHSARQSARIPIGTLMPNSHRQWATARMPAAMVGPTADAVATDEGVDANGASERALRIGETHQGGIDAHDAGGTQPLDRARDAQGRQRRCECAGDRCQR